VRARAGEPERGSGDPCARDWGGALDHPSIVAVATPGMSQAGDGAAVGQPTSPRPATPPDGQPTSRMHRRRLLDGPAARYDARMVETEPVVAALGRCLLFAGLDERGLMSLAREMRLRRFRRGEVLFHQGDPGDALFVVTSGAVKIGLPSEEGDEAIIATVRRGEFFGELALLDGAPRSATATALEATETLVLPRSRFRELINGEPALRDALLAALTSELRRLTTHVQELHFLDITGRLAARLSRLAQTEGRPGDGGTIRLDAPLTQSDLAAMIGATRQSVNKLLGLFVDDGLLRLERDAIVILDRDGLDRMSRR